VRSSAKDAKAVPMNTDQQSRGKDVFSETISAGGRVCRSLLDKHRVLPKKKHNCDLLASWSPCVCSGHRKGAQRVPRADSGTRAISGAMRRWAAPYCGAKWAPSTPFMPEPERQRKRHGSAGRLQHG
jgi:hypothetical protein